MTFLTSEIMKGTDWRAFERAVARVMLHCGWKDVSVIGESGDKGADIIASRETNGKRETWVTQVKAITGGKYVGVAGVNEATQAQAVYNAHVAVLATNGDFTRSVETRQATLTAAGFNVKRWNGTFLRQILDKASSLPIHRKEPRQYQKDVIEKSLMAFDEGKNKVQYVVATGLGKTLIAAELIEELRKRGCKSFLVLCHAQDLALQLEQSFWSQIDKEIPTRYFFDGVPPLVYDGVNFGLYQTLRGWLSGLEPNSFDVIIIDEAHHAMAHGFRACLEHLTPKFLVGMTATPWRGDGVSIDQLFGEPIAKVSLVDGMSLGYLAQVDYRLYCDNIDWRSIPDLTSERLTVRDLNKQLFLPQRDEAILNEVIRNIKEISAPRVAIFSPSIEHARRFAEVLSAAGIPCRSLSGIDKVERRRRLLEFASGRLTAVTAVDVLNEGIDVPDVNLMIFMRATHSRRIFVQQLGRGLRLAPNKEKVIVLDFVSDIRRLAEVVELDREIKKENTKRTIYLRSNVAFSDIRAQKFIESWIEDITNLAETDESEKLKFPEVFE